MCITVVISSNVWFVLTLIRGGLMIYLQVRIFKSSMLIFVAAIHIHNCVCPISPFT